MRCGLSQVGLWHFDAGLDARVFTVDATTARRMASYDSENSVLDAASSYLIGDMVSCSPVVYLL
jgi:hypothetical protein